MPMIDLTVPKGSLTPERTQHLVEELSRIIIKWEGVEYSELYRYATRVYVHEAAGVAVAMRLHDPLKRPYYRVIVSIPEGTLNMQRKRGVIKEVTEAILRSEGEQDMDPRHLERVWCTSTTCRTAIGVRAASPGASASSSSSSNSTRRAIAIARSRPKVG